MKDELLNMKRNALMLGLCGEYRSKWDGAGSDRDLMDIALDVNGVEFICEGVTDGWGLTPEYIRNRFGGYVNGRYVRSKDGYTSEMLCCFDESEFRQRSTITTIIACNTEVIVPRCCISKIYVCGGSKLTLLCDGICELYVYGRDNEIKIHGCGRVNRTDVEKKKWVNENKNSDEDNGNNEKRIRSVQFYRRAGE